MYLVDNLQMNMKSILWCKTKKIDDSKRIQACNDVIFNFKKLVSILSDVEQFHHNFTQIFGSPTVHKRIK